MWMQLELLELPGWGRITYCACVTRTSSSGIGAASHRWRRPLCAVGTGLVAGAGAATTFSTSPTPFQLSALIVVILLTTALAWEAPSLRDKKKSRPFTDIA
jgi:hypothetical protein